MSKTRRWLVLATVSAGLPMVSADTTALYTALPTPTSQLHADAQQKLWIINAYPLVMAGLLPGAGTLGDRVGHKRMLLAGPALFAAAAGRLPAGQARTLLDAAASAFDNGYTLALAITAIALAAGSAFTYRYLKRQPATPAEQAQHTTEGIGTAGVNTTKSSCILDGNDISLPSKI